MLAYTIYQPDIPGTDQIYDGALAITFNILKTLAGPDWEADEVHLYRPRPVEIAPYRRHYRTRLCFSAEHAAVVFAASWLDRPLGGADAQVHREIMRELKALEARGAGDLPTQLRRVLRRLLIGGACREETCLEHVAKLFAIHRRTLNRRLRAQGTSFKMLIEETRYDIARQLLRDTHLSVAEIAAALDYSQSSALRLPPLVGDHTGGVALDVQPRLISVRHRAVASFPVNSVGWLRPVDCREMSIVITA